jgi:hypothetical protein
MSMETLEAVADSAPDNLVRWLGKHVRIRQADAGVPIEYNGVVVSLRHYRAIGWLAYVELDPPALFEYVNASADMIVGQVA